MQGKQQTVGLLDDWVKSRELSHEQGVAELTKRYFTSHGPATIQDFMWWSGLKKAEIAAGLKANLPHLKSETIEGKEYWLAAKTPEPSDTTNAFLLPGFDEYLLGYKDRSAVLHADHAPKILPGGNGVFTPTVVIDGQVVGTWKRTVKKDHVVIELSPFTRFSAADLKLVNQAAEQYGQFLGLPIKLANS
jgi:hypothetical protein